MPRWSKLSYWVYPRLWNYIQRDLYPGYLPTMTTTYNQITGRSYILKSLKEYVETKDKKKKDLSLKKNMNSWFRSIFMSLLC